MEKYNLKGIRNLLGLTQKEVADNNLSPNMLSTIETGKASLTKQKALLLYKKYIEASFIKNISIEIEFDDLLSNNIEYQKYKMANDICSMLKDRVQHKDELSELQLEEYVKFALKTRIGLMRYFILIYSSQLLNKKNKTLKMQWCYKALDFLRWKDFTKISRLYKKALDIVKLLAFREAEYTKLIDYYEFYVHKMIQNEEHVHANIYFNLGLFYFNSYQYEKAKQNLNKYKNGSKSLSIGDKIDLLIMEGVIAFNIANVEEGMKLHREGLRWIEELNDKSLQYQKLIILSNLILNIIKKEIDVSELNLKYWVEEANMIFNKRIDSVSQKSRIMCSIALGYARIGDKSAADDHFKKAMKFSGNPDFKLRRLYDYFTYSSNNNDDDFIVEELINIDYRELSDQSRLKYMLLIFDIIKCNYFKAYHGELLEIIEKIKKEVI